MKSNKIILFLLLFCCSCGASITNIKDYYSYINNKENGLILYKKIGNISFVMKHLPTDFFVYRTDKNASKEVQDSLRNELEPSLNFILKITPSEDAEVKFDVMTETVSSLAEFKQHAFTMNFDLQKLIHINVEGQEIKPVLVETENIYGLKQHRLINIVFAKETLGENWLKTKEIDLTFNDEIYGTGIHHFVFDKSDFDAVPSLNI